MLISKLKTKKKLFIKKLQEKKVSKFGVCTLLFTNLLSFWPITSRVICFQLFQRIRNQRKILRFLNTHMQKTKKLFWGSLSTNRVCFRISKIENSQEMALPMEKRF
jgi:hypothetical protein